MKIINQTKGAIISQQTRMADTFFSRLKGLLGTASLPEGQGLIIRPCNSIHTFGMRYDIDVLFVDGHNQVRKIVSAIAPGKIAMCRSSEYVIELPAGTAEATGTEIGDQLKWF